MNDYTEMPTWTPVRTTTLPNGDSSDLILGTFSDRTRAERAATLQLLAELNPDLGSDADFDDVQDQLPELKLSDLLLPASSASDALVFLTLAQHHEWKAAMIHWDSSSLPVSTGHRVSTETYTVEMTKVRLTR